MNLLKNGKSRKLFFFNKILEHFERHKACLTVDICKVLLELIKGIEEDDQGDEYDSYYKDVESSHFTIKILNILLEAILAILLYYLL
jgi:hypothetical protein